jgi:hypothetical protein
VKKLCLSLMSVIMLNSSLGQLSSLLLLTGFY